MASLKDIIIILVVKIKICSINILFAIKYIILLLFVDFDNFIFT